jgi:tetratricopeptide (TPR) repeat protein
MAYESTIAGTDVRTALEAGLAAHQSGDFRQALAAYSHVLSLAPEYGPALNLTGTALLQLGRASEAVSFLERATRHQRGDANVLGNLAQAYLALRRFGDAADTFRKAARIAPAVPQFQSGVAAALALAGKLGEAEVLLQRLTARFPDSPLVWLNLGHVFRDTRRYDQAIDAYRKALACDATLIDARLSLGNVLHSSLRLDEAQAEYEACLYAAPDHLVARMNLASLHMARGRYAAAETACRDIVRRSPERSDAHRLMGTALAQQQRLLDALECYRRAAELAPGDPAAARAYGGLLMEVGDAANGLRWMAHALALEPDSVHTHRVVSGTLLAHGRLQDGWIHYVHRPGAAELREKHRAWQPSDSSKRVPPQSRVCVIGEQGLGDELFFMRYVPRLALTGTSIHVRCNARLAPLLRRVDDFPEIIVDDAQVRATDVRILCGDLPLVLGNRPRSELARSAGVSPAAIREHARRICLYSPSPAPSLVIPELPERRAEMRGRLAALGSPPYIGITWRGGIAPEDQQGADAVLFKSVDPQMLAAALVSVPGTVIALQRNPKPGELERASEALGRPVHDLTAINEDLEAMLALLSALEEYIGVSNTNMHLRAAACRTGRVLVQAPAEWRWMQSGKTSPWFPGFSIYRQSLNADWTRALSALKSDLEVNYGPLARSNSARI